MLRQRSRHRPLLVTLTIGITGSALSKLLTGSYEADKAGYEADITLELNGNYESQWPEEFVWQRPLGRPRGTVVLLHGCTHFATHYWPPGPKCAACLGLPEDIQTTQAVLQAGWAALAISAPGRSGCFFPDAASMIARVIRRFERSADLPQLPIGAITVSQGALPIPALSRLVTLRAAIHESYPFTSARVPTLFLTMEKDKASYFCALEKAAALRASGIRAAADILPARPVTAASLVNLIPGLTLNASSAIVASLYSAGMLPSAAGGALLRSPRNNERRWMSAVRPVMESYGVAGAAGTLEPIGDSSLYEEVAYVSQTRDSLTLWLLAVWIRLLRSSVC